MSTPDPLPTDQPAASPRIPGSYLSYFDNPAEGRKLTAAERNLLRAGATGVHAALTDPRKDDDDRFNNTLPRPTVKDDTTIVHADFLRFLVLGGGDDAPVNDRTIDLFNAFIVGKLDLTGAAITRIVRLVACVIEEKVRLDFAATKSLDFTRSELCKGMSAEGLKCEGSLWLRETDARALVALNSASIDGFLLAEGVSLATSTATEWALAAEGLHVARTFRLNRATDGAKRAAEVKGSMLLAASAIDGDLLIDEASVLSAHDTSGIVLQRTEVGGIFSVKLLSAVEGLIDLTQMKVAILADDMASWQRASGQLLLDGFVYDRLASDAATSAVERRRWLDCQRVEEKTFRPQPWDQLIAALRAGGHPLDATRLAIMKLDAYRAAGKVRGLGRPIHWLWGKTVGYGYKPENLAYWLSGLWAGAALVYALVAPASADDVRRAAQPRALVASDLLVPAKSAVAPDCLAAGRSAAACPMVPVRKEFSAAAFSSDNLVPGLKLGAADDWRFNWRTEWPHLVPPPVREWPTALAAWSRHVVVPPGHDWGVAALFVLVWIERIAGGVGFGVLGVTVAGYLFKGRE